MRSQLDMELGSLVEPAEPESVQVAVPSIASRCQDGRSVEPREACSAGPSPTNCCQDGEPSAAVRGEGCCQLGVDCCGGCSHGRAWLVNCCHAGRGSSAGGSADHAVLEIAGCEPGVSTGGLYWLAAPLCQASVVERQPCEPVVERHSVVCRQRAPVAR